MASPTDAERSIMELDLLHAMYPSEISFDTRSREVTFIPQHVATPQTKLSLRLPDDYPSKSRPIIISAAYGIDDLRNSMKDVIENLAQGEETLDAILIAFQDLAVDRLDSVPDASDKKLDVCDRSLTVIIWLHHLLSTTKRKAILAPPGDGVSGIAKPGYPGVIILTGPTQYVQEHVRSLREMNWQAFQVRAEIAEHWQLTHGSGVVEVETMADVVEKLGSDERKKNLFLEVFKIK